MFGADAAPRSTALDGPETARRLTAVKEYPESRFARLFPDPIASADDGFV